jgi:hypothetical protein
MIERRDFLIRGAGFVAGTTVLESCSDGSREHYADVTAKTWRHTVGRPRDSNALMRDLVQYATLAPSSHNTQCWKFKLGGDRLVIVPDYSRRCPVVDPDDHHLFVSLGCAAEKCRSSSRGEWPAVAGRVR